MISRPIIRKALRNMNEQELRTRYKELLAAYREKNRELKKLKRRKKVEFSKIVLISVMFTYYLVLAVGIYAVIHILLDFPEHAITALVALLSYVGAPTGVTIAFYSWKAKNENALKIKKSVGKSGETDGGE